MKQLGFIGAGNMGSAIINGVLAAGWRASDIWVSDADERQLVRLAGEKGIHIGSNEEVAAASDVVLLCVKPHIYETVAEQIKQHLRPGAIVVCIAAGISHSWMAFHFGDDVKIVRAMPNTPALVGKGMTAISPGGLVNENDMSLVMSIFGSLGKAEILEERLFNAFIGVAGSSPAYAFMLIEAMADAGVKYGLPRAKAIEFSAQAVLGAAEMVLQTGQHPAALRDAVCSPGGATIEAVCEMERQGLRNAVISGVQACIEKAFKMEE